MQVWYLMWKILAFSTSLFCFQISDKSDQDSVDYGPVSGEYQFMQFTVELL